MDPLHLGQSRAVHGSLSLRRTERLHMVVALMEFRSRVVHADPVGFWPLSGSRKAYDDSLSFCDSNPSAPY